MKTLKQILNESDTLKIRENINGSELVEMVELGLLEKNKLPLLERALNMDVDLMTEAEKNILVDLLQRLISEKTSDSKSINLSYTGTNKQTDYTSDSKIPVIITFRRKSIRVFPNSVKIALYYSPQLDKYISIPFGEKSAETLGTNLSEESADLLSNYRRRTREELPASDRRSSKNIKARWAWRNIKRYPGNKEERARRVAGAANKAGSQGGQVAADVAAVGTMGLHGAALGAKGIYKGAKAIGRGVKKMFKEGTPEETFATYLEEARKARVVKYKPKKSRRKASKIKSLGSSRSSSWKLPAPKKPKKTKRKAATKTQVKATNTTKTETKKVVVDNKHVDSYVRAKKAYDRATSRPLEARNAQGKKETLDAKDHYKRMMNHHAEKIRAAGGSVPHVPEPNRNLKRSPHAKKPPAMAEEHLQEAVPVALAVGAAARAAAPHVARGAGAIARGAAKLGSKGMDMAKKLLKNRKRAESVRKAKQLKQNSKTRAAAGKKKVGPGWRKGRSLGDFISKRKENSSNDNSQELRKDWTGRSRSEVKSLGRVEGPQRVTDDKTKAQATKSAYGDEPRNRDLKHFDESNFNLIRSLAESNQGGKIEIPFDGDTVSINSRIAKKVLAIHETLNKSNKKNMENMLNESISSFRKVINFAIRA